MEPTPTTEALFKCPKLGCGGPVTSYAGDGRFFFHRSILINLPVKLLVPRCQSCKQDYLTPTLQVAVDKVLDEEYKLHEHFITKALASKKKRGEN